MKALVRYRSLAVLLIFFSSEATFAGPIVDTSRVYGVTLTGISGIASIVTALSMHHYKPTARIVFDEWVPATEYLSAVSNIHNVSFIMGEILDSWYFRYYTHEQYRQRVLEYLNVLGDRVDIWEIGNEVNGEWLGTTQSVIEKITTAYNIVKQQDKKAALTLYYNKNCWENPQNEMFRWVNTNISKTMKRNLDYVLVSYYEDDCNGYQPDWQRVFDSLHVIFPNSKIGIGECGTRNTELKETYINRYYRMTVTTPGYIGGYFWWYYKKDCVPYTKPLWLTLNTALSSGMKPPPEYSGPAVMNFPNPFNPSTVISFSLPNSSHTVLTVYDILGKEVSRLIDRYTERGTHSVVWDGSEHVSGVYFYRLESYGYSVSGKMLLIK